MKFIKSELAKQKWYRQGGAIKLAYISVPWSGCLNMTLDSLPIHLDYNFLIYFRSNFATLFLPYIDAEMVANFYIKLIKQKPDEIERIYKKWRGSYELFRDAVISGELTDGISSLSDSDFVRHFNVSLNMYRHLYQEAIFHDSFDVMGEKVIEDAMRKHGLTLSMPEVAILTANRRPMPIQIERAALARLTLQAVRNRRLKNLIKQRKLGQIRKELPHFAEGLRSHAEHYFWMHNDYDTIKHLGERWFLAEM